MDLIAEPDIYEPSIGENRDYLDKIPNTHKFKNGLRCPCGSRKEHVFYNKQSFCVHLKSKTHIKWLHGVNENKLNYYTETIQLQETLNNQKIIIARLQKENDENIRLIAHLTKKMEMREHSNIAVDLLSFD
jgi:hypothetical protein